MKISSENGRFLFRVQFCVLVFSLVGFANFGQSFWALVPPPPKPLQVLWNHIFAFEIGIRCQLCSWVNLLAHSPMFVQELANSSPFL